MGQDFEEGLTKEGVGGSGRNFLDPGGIGGTKFPKDPKIAPGFEPFMAALGPLLEGITGSAAPFGAGGQFSASNIFNSDFFKQQGGLASDAASAFSDSGTFENSLSGLNDLISGDAGSGITSGLIGEFNALQRPGLDLQKQFLEADVFEGAARSGTARSTGTGQALAQGFGQIEAGGAQAAGQFASAVAPSAIGAQAGAVMQGLGLPGQLAGNFAGPLSQLLQSGQFQQAQAGQAFSDIFAGIPIQEGRLGGKAQGQAGDNIGGMIGGMCWIAREVYGTENTKWIHFRDFMLNDAPAEFVQFYLDHGLDIAAQIIDDPEAKDRIRASMDKILDARTA